MKVYKLSEFKRGWFVGDFDPSLIKTQDVEVAVQTFKAGDVEAEHYHGVAQEITVIIEGRAEMFGEVYGPGQIIVISPGESTAFRAIDDVKTVVVKYPGATNDKYLIR